MDNEIDTIALDGLETGPITNVDIFSLMLKGIDYNLSK